MPHKPTLTALIIRRYLWAALLTLGLMLLAILMLTDIVMMRSRRHALAEQLFAIENADDAMLMLYDAGGAAKTHAGSLILDAQGHWSPGQPDGPPARPSPRWNLAQRVLSEGALRGTGRLPWVDEPVVWAARKLENPDGDPEIVVAWEQVSAVRIAMQPIYFSAVLATLLAFGVSTAVALNTVKGVRGVLDNIAQSSGRMAAGDFRMRLPAQPAEELDRVSSSINQLAHDLAQTTDDLHDQHAQLLRLEGLRRQFVADASHELRSPLTAMRVTLEAWQDGVLRPEEQPEALVELHRETERLGSLVTKLLDLSRIETGREIVSLETVDVQAIAQQVRRGFRDGPGAAVELALPADLPPVLADADAIFRILQNLVENACRFTPPDGSIRIWAEIEGESVRLGVTDTGAGIPPEFLPFIWDRFARAPSARSEGKAGSGLGLAIVKALAATMGGEVGADSTPGVSTTIWVRLHAAEQAIIAEKLSLA